MTTTNRCPVCNGCLNTGGNCIDYKCSSYQSKTSDNLVPFTHGYNQSILLWSVVQTPTDQSHLIFLMPGSTEIKLGIYDKTTDMIWTYDKSGEAVEYNKFSSIYGWIYQGNLKFIREV